MLKSEGSVSSITSLNETDHSIHVREKTVTDFFGVQRFIAFSKPGKELKSIENMINSRETVI